MKDKEGSPGFRNTRTRQAIARKGPIVICHEQRWKKWITINIFFCETMGIRSFGTMPSLSVFTLLYRHLQTKSYTTFKPVATHKICILMFYTTRPLQHTHKISRYQLYINGFINININLIAELSLLLRYNGQIRHLPNGKSEFFLNGWFLEF